MITPWTLVAVMAIALALVAIFAVGQHLDKRETLLRIRDEQEAEILVALERMNEEELASARESFAEKQIQPTEWPTIDPDSFAVEDWRRYESRLISGLFVEAVQVQEPGWVLTEEGSDEFAERGDYVASCDGAIYLIPGRFMAKNYKRA